MTTLTDDNTIKNPLHCIFLKHLYNNQNPFLNIVQKHDALYRNYNKVKYGCLFQFECMVSYRKWWKWWCYTSEK